MTAVIYDLIAYSESSTNETLSKSISKAKGGERDWRMILELFQKLFSSFKISLETFWEFDEFTPTKAVVVVNRILCICCFKMTRDRNYSIICCLFLNEFIWILTKF